MTWTSRAVFVDGVAQRLAVRWRAPRHRLRAAGASVAARGRVQRRPGRPHQDGADGGLARRLADTVAAPDLDAGKRFLAQDHRPIPKSPWSRVRRTASRRSRGRGCCAREWRRPLRVRGSSISKTSGSERIWSALHDLRRSFAQGWIERRAGQLLAHVPGKGIEKHALGGPARNIRRRHAGTRGCVQPPASSRHGRPCPGTGRVDKGLQQQQRMAETGRPVTHDPTSRTDRETVTRDCDSDAPAGSTGGCCWRQDEGVHTDNGNPSQPKSRAPGTSGPAPKTPPGQATCRPHAPHTKASRRSSAWRQDNDAIASTPGNAPSGFSGRTESISLRTPVSRVNHVIAEHQRVDQTYRAKY